MIHELDIATALQVRKRDNNKNVDFIMYVFWQFCLFTHLLINLSIMYPPPPPPPLRTILLRWSEKLCFGKPLHSMQILINFQSDKVFVQLLMRIKTLDSLRWAD